MSFTCPLYSDKVRCFNQSERALYGNFIIKDNKKRLAATKGNGLDNQLEMAIIINFTDTEVKNCFSIYHTS